MKWNSAHWHIGIFIKLCSHELVKIISYYSACKSQKGNIQLFFKFDIAICHQTFGLSKTRKIISIKMTMANKKTERWNDEHSGGIRELKIRKFDEAQNSPVL